MMLAALPPLNFPNQLKSLSLVDECIIPCCYQDISSCFTQTCRCFFMPGLFSHFAQQWWFYVTALSLLLFIYQLLWQFLGCTWLSSCFRMRVQSPLHALAWKCGRVTWRKEGTTSSHGQLGSANCRGHKASIGTHGELLYPPIVMVFCFQCCDFGCMIEHLLTVWIISEVSSSGSSTIPHSHVSKSRFLWFLMRQVEVTDAEYKITSRKKVLMLLIYQWNFSDHSQSSQLSVWVKCSEQGLLGFSKFLQKKISLFLLQSSFWQQQQNAGSECVHCAGHLAF